MTGHLSLAAANASIRSPHVTQGVGPAADQDIPLAVRKPLDRVVTETSLIPGQLSLRVLHICCPATLLFQLCDSAHILLTARLFQYCGLIYQACP